MIRVVVAEDMTVLREALVGLLDLEADIAVVGQTGNGDAVTDLVATTGADVLVLDIDLPGADGLGIASELTGKPVKVLVLSGLDRPGIVHEALALGVRGFLPKGVSVTAVVDAIRRIAADEVVVSGNLLQSALSHGQMPLSERELAVLGLTAEGYSAKQIGRRLGLVTGTVQNHMTRAMRKLQAGNKVQAVRIATDRGWLRPFER